jgi:G:T-mismatch repair DNA endonuclease (very short patch repair protein)
MLSNSQKYFSKEICVQKYGENEGMKIWQDRQNKWQGTLNSKSAEEKSRINRLKLTKGITVSKAEKLILKAIKETIPDAIHQFTLHESGKKQYIYDIMANNKIIEYNGDFWHSNPSIYSPDFINPRTKVKSIDKWASDAVKLQCARDQGYEVLIIWEHDFKKNQKETIKKCIQFLTS